MGWSLTFHELGITIPNIMWVFPRVAMGAFNMIFLLSTITFSLLENGFPLSLLSNLVICRAAAMLLHDLVPLDTVINLYMK